MRRNNQFTIKTATDKDNITLLRERRQLNLDLNTYIDTLPKPEVATIENNNYRINSVLDALKTIDQDDLFPNSFLPHLYGYNIHRFETNLGIETPFFNPRIVMNFSQKVNFQHLIPTVTPVDKRPYNEVYISLRHFKGTREIPEELSPEYNKDNTHKATSTTSLTLLAWLLFAIAALTFYFSIWGGIAVLTISLILYQTCDRILTKFSANVQTNLVFASEKLMCGNYTKAQKICNSIKTRWLFLRNNSSLYYAQYYNLKGLIHLSEAEDFGIESLLLAKDCFKKACTYSTDPLLAVNHYQTMIFENTHKSEEGQKLREYLSKQYQTSWYIAGLDAKFGMSQPA